MSEWLAEEAGASWEKEEKRGERGEKEVRDDAGCSGVEVEDDTDGAVIMIASV